MTIEWSYTVHDSLGVLALSGYLGAQAAGRFGGAVGWAAARGTGPLILDLARLNGWSVAGQHAIAEAALHLTAHGRPLALAAIPADGSLVPDAAQPPVPVHPDLTAALASYRSPANTSGQRQWHTTAWPQDTPRVN
ncbi:STAS domain-containing protein [Streptomyces albireticuli]|uniref:STAS domain-containing protein n=1 Tax=Streptomyces albireticuli TaxID=1940 RepID=A0A2A2D514_9ACTN|nr:STAS domain-containing protein [Streptomyces albireticuli]MCD9195177.1 STAS domain-containing protein [Streptomyces albireticuli]PAU46624.1 hypothetical protein CK936_23090 [Streptomyces albireticuli]